MGVSATRRNITWSVICAKASSHASRRSARSSFCVTSPSACWVCRSRIRLESIGAGSFQMIDSGIVELDLDPFSLTFLTNPYAYHEQLREAGAAVRLRKYDVWASARFAEVKGALQNWEVFSSAAGVGLTDFRKEPPWRKPS